MGNNENKLEPLVQMQGVQIEGETDAGWIPIIKGVDLTLHRGEVLGLIGESGAGKSTLGLASMGFTRAGCRVSAGTIHFDGVDLLQATLQEKRTLWGRRITYVAQSAAASFNPAHSLIKQTTQTSVREKILPVADAIEDAKKLFGKLSLPNPDTIGLRYPHQVSGGQLQRIMTAMAMAPRPDLIIFDEPTTALDVTTQVEVLRSIKDIVHEFNTAAIYITHDLAVVAQMADRIKVMQHGREVEEAATRDILAEPKEEYTKTLWSVRSLHKPVQESDKAALEINNVDAAYGPITVLNNISLHIPKGRTLSVVGESGCGKSTLARVIIGLLPHKSGEVLFNGTVLPKRLEQRHKDLKRRIQLIYQTADTAMNPRHTIEEIIGRPLTFYHNIRGQKRHSRVCELLDQIGLDREFTSRLPSEISGGQKQRVCIARALAADPEVIICDEVTSALDQIVQEGILRLLMDLQKEKGLTYLFITHDIATVEAISDQIVVMNQGQVVEQGNKDSVLSPPHPDYTQKLLASVPQMDPDWLENLEQSKK